MKQINKFDINIDELKSFDIKEYVLKVISHWKLFMVMLILGLLIATFINKRAQRIYSLNSVITVKEEQNPLFTSSTNIAFNWGGPSDKVENIIEILNSRTHNEKVINKLKYYIDYFQEGRFRMIDVYGNIPFELQLDSLGYQLSNTPIKFEFLENEEVLVSTEFDQDAFSLINYTTNSTKNYKPENNTFSKKFSINEFIDTPFCRIKINNRTGTYKLAGKTYFVKFKSFNGTVQAYQILNVKTLTKGTSLIELELKGPNKKKIEDYLNATVEVLDQDQKNQKIQYAIRTKEYIDTVFNFASNNLKTIEKDLGDFKQKNKVYDLSVEGEALFSQVTELDTKQQQVSDRLEYFNNLESYILSNREIGDDIPAPVNVTIEDPNITKNIVELVELSKQKKSLEQTVTPDYPPLKNINDKINITRDVVLENITNLKNATRINLSNIRNRI